MFQPVRDPSQHPCYLGDGVYASFDGYQIWLRTESETGTNDIALDGPTFKALLAYQQRLQDEVKP
jgi:hypothetical protein